MGSTGTTQAPPPVKNWGTPGITGAANDATALQPTPSPQPNLKASGNTPLSTIDALNALGPTPSENIESEGEEDPASLSNALSMFTSPDAEDSEEPTEQDDSEDIDTPVEDIDTIETEVEKEEDLEPSEIESTDEEDSADKEEKSTEEIESVEEVDSADKEEKPTEEIEWGAWSEDIDEDFEPQDIVPGLGPQSDGEILKPLPGTKEGESGWYFDVDGKPALWSFEPIGWEKRD